MHIASASKRFINAVKAEIEIIVLLLVFLYWYLSNIDGFLGSDMGIGATASYALVTGRNMYLEAVHPPLAQYIIGSGQLIFGETLFGAKISSIIFAILTIYFTYRIGRKIGNRYTGFFAALLLGLTNLYSRHVVQVTYDVILTFFVILLFYAAIIYREQQSKKNSFAFILGILLAFVATSKTQGLLYGIFIFALILFEDQHFKRGSSDSKIGRMLEGIRSVQTGIKKIIKNHRVRYFLSGFLLAFIVIYLPYLSFDPDGISNELAWRNVPDNPLVKYIPRLPAIFYMFGTAYWAASLRTVNPSYQFLEPSYWIFKYGGLTYMVGILVAIIYVIQMKIKGKKIPQNFSFLIAYTAASFFLINMIFPAPRYLLPFLPFFSILVTTSVLSYIKLSLTNHQSKIALTCMIVLSLLSSSLIISTLEAPELAEKSVYADTAHYLLNYAESRPDKKIVAVIPHIVNYYIIDKPANLDIEDVPYPLAYTGYNENYSEKLLHRIKSNEIDIFIERKPLPGEFGYPVNQQLHEYAANRSKFEVTLESETEGQIYIYYLT